MLTATYVILSLSVEQKKERQFISRLLQTVQSVRRRPQEIDPATIESQLKQLTSFAEARHQRKVEACLMPAVCAAARATVAAVPAFTSAVAPVGIAGTMTTLAAVFLRMKEWDGKRVHGLHLPVKELERVVAELAALPLAERSNVPGLEPKRADVIVAGGHIALAYLAHVGASEVIVSDRGVRWGLAAQLSS